MQVSKEMQAWMKQSISNIKGHTKDLNSYSKKFKKHISKILEAKKNIGKK